MKPSGTQRSQRMAMVHSAPSSHPHGHSDTRAAEKIVPAAWPDRARQLLCQTCERDAAWACAERDTALQVLREARPEGDLAESEMAWWSAHAGLVPGIASHSPRQSVALTRLDHVELVAAHAASASNMTSSKRVGKQQGPPRSRQHQSPSAGPWATRLVTPLPISFPDIAQPTCSLICMSWQRAARRLRISMGFVEQRSIPVIIDASFRVTKSRIMRTPKLPGTGTSDVRTKQTTREECASGPRAPTSEGRKEGASHAPEPCTPGQILSKSSAGLSVKGFADPNASDLYPTEGSRYPAGPGAYLGGRWRRRCSP